MVAGYPGRTNRYRLADEVLNAFEWSYPTRQRLMKSWLEVIERETAQRPDASIKYASRVAGLNNSIKNSQGMLDSYAKSDIVERKKALENDLEAWIEADPSRGRLYGGALADLQQLVERDLASRHRDLFYSGFAQRSDLYGAARTLYRLSVERQKPDAEREAGYQERDVRRIGERMARIDRTFDAEVDRACWRELLLAYAAIPTDQHVTEFDAWFGISGNQVDLEQLDRRLAQMYEATELERAEVRESWMEAAPETFRQSEDPFIRLAVAMYDRDMELERQAEDLRGRFAVARPRYMESLIAYRDSRGEAVYPDANGTLRVTYGKVGGYSPRDGVWFTPFTTVGGILQKDTGEDPFDAPAGLLKAARTASFGEYLDPEIGSVPVDFLSDVDTTGGNSGSPTLNARGELVGLLFDGTYESIISDWDFLPDVTRSIHVDVRYAMWVMEYVDGAVELLREMRGQQSTAAKR
jgi:hypothetical protein